MAALPAAAVADALVRLGLPVRLAPATIRRAVLGDPIAGPAVPVRHFGSVDVFLEAYEAAPPGGILVIDNEGRVDEACIGDLTVAEARLAGLTGIVLWGYHRDSAALPGIGLSVWSLGALPAGPRAPRTKDGDPFAKARVGDIVVTRSDVVVADDDGVVFVEGERWPEVESIATKIAADEGRQADMIARGTSLRGQLDFAGYLARRATVPGYTLRQHLLERGGAIET
ncbi:MAG: RraA family protein [Candidatus Limnocylindrales bacterium]